MADIVYMLRVPVREDTTAYHFGATAALECVPLGQRRHDGDGMRDFTLGLLIGAANAYEAYHGVDATRRFLAFLADTGEQQEHA